MSLLTRLRALDLDVFRQHLEYDETSPSGLRWVASTGCFKTKPGDVAGSLNARGYWRITCHRQYVRNHNLILLLHDRWPEENQECDHIDRNTRNNCISNLRWVTRTQNMYNRHLPNKTGYKFVSSTSKQPLRPFNAGYYSPITKRFVHAGAYSDPCEAHLAAITHRLEHCWNP